MYQIWFFKMRSPILAQDVGWLDQRFMKNKETCLFLHDIYRSFKQKFVLVLYIYIYINIGNSPSITEKHI